MTRSTTDSSESRERLCNDVGFGLQIYSNDMRAEFSQHWRSLRAAEGWKGGSVLIRSSFDTVSWCHLLYKTGLIHRKLCYCRLGDYCQ